MNDTILPSQNPDWGFFGSIADYAEPEEAWKLAMQTIARATACPPDRGPRFPR